MEKSIVVLGQQITWYAVMGLVGLSFSMALCMVRRNRFSIGRGDVINLGGYAVVGILIGSKVLALLCMIPGFIEYWDKITWNRELFNVVMKQGFVFYGGLLGVIGAFAVYCKQYGLSLSHVLELAAPACPLFHVFGRIGCYIAGCCYGVLSFPLQLIEAAMNLVIFSVIMTIQDRRILEGKTFYLYLLLYAAGRFILEFFRGDVQRGFIGALSVSQWISLGILAVSISKIGIWVGCRRRNL